jgi:hypothetical protein
MKRLRKSMKHFRISDIPAENGKERLPKANVPAKPSNPTPKSGKRGNTASIFPLSRAAYHPPEDDSENGQHFN